MSLAVLIPIAVATGVISVFLLGQIFRAHRRRVQTGMEAMMRQCAVAQEKFVPDQSGFHGQVFVRGELWNAHCADPVGDGQDLVVTGRDGLVLTVIPRNALVED